MHSQEQKYQKWGRWSQHNENCAVILCILFKRTWGTTKWMNRLSVMEISISCKCFGHLHKKCVFYQKTTYSLEMHHKSVKKTHLNLCWPFSPQMFWLVIGRKKLKCNSSVIISPFHRFHVGLTSEPASTTAGSNLRGEQPLIIFITYHWRSCHSQKVMWHTDAQNTSSNTWPLQ